MNCSVVVGPFVLRAHFSEEQDSVAEYRLSAVRQLDVHSAESPPIDSNS